VPFFIIRIAFGIWFFYLVIIAKFSSAIVAITIWSKLAAVATSSRY
jgi:hypothetical protein